MPRFAGVEMFDINYDVDLFLSRTEDKRFFKWKPCKLANQLFNDSEKRVDELDVFGKPNPIGLHSLENIIQKYSLIKNTNRSSLTEYKDMKGESVISEFSIKVAEMLSELEKRVNDEFKKVPPHKERDRFLIFTNMYYSFTGTTIGYNYIRQVLFTPRLGVKTDCVITDLCDKIQIKLEANLKLAYK